MNLWIKWETVLQSCPNELVSKYLECNITQPHFLDVVRFITPQDNHAIYHLLEYCLVAHQILFFLKKNFRLTVYSMSRYQSASHQFLCTYALWFLVFFLCLLIRLMEAKRNRNFQNKSYFEALPLKHHICRHVGK